MSFEAMLDTRIETKRKQLLERTKNLKFTLEQAIKQLEENGSVNRAGEVQGQGLNVDILCSEYEYLKEIRQDLNMYDKVK